MSILKAAKPTPMRFAAMRDAPTDTTGIIAHTDSDKIAVATPKIYGNMGRGHQRYS